MKRSAFFLLVFSCFLFNVSQAQVACNALWSSSASGSTVNFQDQSTSNSTITNWTWDFGDGSFSNQQNPVHAYASQGYFGVTLSITSSQGCTDSYYDTLLVSGTCSTACQAAFTHVENGATVNFTDSSTSSGNITGWYWDYGDGSYSYNQNPSHAYAASGLYNVCLTIFTDDSCSSTVCDSFFVQCSSPCGPANFTYTVSGNTVSFVNTSAGTYASSGWIFGGNLPGSTQTNPTVTYPGPGTYSVCLCVYDANGNLCDISCQTIVIPGPPITCEADFIAIDSGNNIIFIDQSTSSAANIYYSWNFGDGVTSNQQNPTHYYNNPGTYGPCLTITSISLAGDTCTSTHCDTVVIGNNQCGPASFTYTTSGNTVVFNNTSSGTYASSGWTFGASGIPSSTQTNPTVTYPGPGTYTVCLCIYDANGNLCDIVCDSVVVGPTGCNLNVGVTYTISGNTVQFNGSITGPPSTYFYWYFGDGSPSIYGDLVNGNLNPVHTYNGPGTYIVSLFAADSINGSCWDSIQVPIVITGGCNANAAFTYSISGNTVTFNNTSTLPNFGTAYWYFSDGSNSYQWNPTHTFPGPGTYYACLTVEDSINWNCYDSTCVSIVIPASSNCQAAFTSIDSGNTVIFIDQSTTSSPFTSYYWNFGDGNTSNQQSPIHYYSNPGTYNPCLTITSISLFGDTCTSTVCDTVVIGGSGCNVNAAFTYTVSGNTVSYINNSYLPNTGNSLWDFGDGTISGLWNPSHTFPGPGTYYTCLLVEDSLNWNCNDSTCMTIVIPGSSNCQAAFTTIDSGNTVIFIDQSTSSSPFTSYYWNFGDGNTSNQQSPIHYYSNPGTYNPCLTITSISLFGDTCTSTVCDTVVIGGSGCNVNAAFTYTVSGNTVSYINNSYLPNTGNSLWDFGDGTISGLSNPSHTFPGPGTYFTCLLVEDSLNWNCSDSTCMTIVIPAANNCQADFIAIDSGNTIIFIDQSTSSNPISGYYWNFGDGNTSYQQSPFHYYSNPGTYFPCLTIYSISGISDTCISTVCDTIVVGGSSGCTASASFTHSVVGTTVSFTNTSTLPQNGAAIYWYFSDGSYSNQWNPTHTFPSTGNYFACLTISDTTNWSCYDSTCVSINIAQRGPTILSQLPIWDLGFKSVNPIGEQAEISFDMDQPGDLRIAVYDLTGKEVKVITEGNQTEGHHELQWQADDLSAGMYFYRIQIGEYIQTEKFIKL